MFESQVFVNCYDFPSSDARTCTALARPSVCQPLKGPGTQNNTPKKTLIDLDFLGFSKSNPSHLEFVIFQPEVEAVADI